MQIWSAEIKELESFYKSVKDRFPELEKELEHLIETKDANVVLLYSRRCLEVIIIDLCESELQRSRGTEPLKGIIDKLGHEKKVPSHIIASMDGLNTLSTFGTHPKDFDPRQVKPVLNNLTTIIEWYLKYKGPQTISKTKPGEAKFESKEPVETREGIPKPKKKLILLLSGLLVVMAIVVALFVFNIIGGGKQTKELEKSIAVLPFKSLSTDPEKQYLADGMMDAILLHLSKIEDLRVLSRTSTEQYKESGKTMTEIGRELGVGYLLEGSFQKYGDDVRLIVQLIQAGKEGHVWADQYDRKWNDIFSVQSDVAQTIARELHTIITPQEKVLIERIPTTDLAAYDLYLKANDYQEDYAETGNLSSYQAAVNLYNTALEIDSSFARAYTGLANAYYDRYYNENYFKEGFLDSCLLLANLALSFDDKLDEAYWIKGEYYWENGYFEEAMDNYDRALKFNPNYFLAYQSKGYMLIFVIKDFVKGLENYHKALIIINGNERPELLSTLGHVYRDVGFMEKAKKYEREAYELGYDEADYLVSLAWIEFCLENFEEALNLAKKAHEIDSTYSVNLMFYEVVPDHNEEAYIQARKLAEYYEESGELNLQDSHHIGYFYWQEGHKEDAKEYFDQQIKYCEEGIKLKRNIADWGGAQYDLAMSYAFLGDTQKAYQYLDEIDKLNFFPIWWVSYAKHNPFMNSISNEERYQKILQNMETKYQAEHERVRKWLEEKGE